MGYPELHLPAALARSLTTLGWAADDPLVRGATPTAARGHNLVAVIPPAPPWATPVLAGMLAARVETPGLILVLAPQEGMAEWTAVLDPLAEAGGPRPLVALGPGQAARRLQSGTDLRIMVTTPATALALRTRSQLALDTIAAVVLAWPERWDDPEAIVALMTDMGRDTQRVMLTAAPARTAPLAERYAFKALHVGPAGSAVPAGPVRTMATPWSGRVAAITALAEALDPTSLAVWTVGTERHDALRLALSGLGIPVEITHVAPGPATVVIAFDPPTPEGLRTLLEAGPVVLLAPPGTESYLASIANPREPVAIAGALDAAVGRIARRRSRIERVLNEVALDHELVALSPLFEIHEPAAVAAALYHLWAAAAEPSVTPATTAAPLKVARLWVGVGKKDAASPADLVGLLTNELRLDRSRIGKVEIRETFSLIEVPAEEATRIASAITGRTVRRRRLIAKVDEARPTERPAPRGRPRR